MAGQYAQPGPYAVEHGMPESMPSTSRDAEMSTDNNGIIGISPAMQDSAGIFPYEEYGRQNFNANSELGHQHRYEHLFMPGSSVIRYSTNPAYAVPSTSKQGDTTDGTDFFSTSPYMCASAQNERVAFEGQQRTEEQGGEYIQQQCMGQPSAYENTFDQLEDSASLYANEGKAGSEESRERSDFDSIKPDEDISMYDASQPIDAWINRYFLPAEPVEESSPSIASTSASSEKNTSARRARAEKRKSKNVDGSADTSSLQQKTENKRKKRRESLEEVSDSICEKQEIERAESDQEETVQEKQPKASKDAGQNARRVSSLFVKLWNNTRLTNGRRMSYKSLHKTIYRYEYSNFTASMAREILNKSYQAKIRNYIESFSAKTAPLIKQNALWYFIASRTTNIATKHRDLLWLKELLSEKKESKHKKLIMNLEGYYPGVIDDMLAYMEKHKSLRVAKVSPPTVWKETLGDLYIRKNLDLNYSMLENQDTISQIDQRYSALAYALRMILALPEVHHDFTSISINLIKDTKMSVDASTNKQKQQVLLAIYTLVNEKTGNNKKAEKSYEKLHGALVSVYRKEGKKESTAPELYNEMYRVLADFYDKVKVFDANEYILAGKCVIKHQMYVKCEAILEHAPDGSSIQISYPEYSFEMDKWKISFDVEPHYHVYYVDNAIQQSRMLCMPIYKKDGSKEEHYLHTIEGIVNYIKMVHRIKIKLDHIHPFKVHKKTREWSYIKRREERRKTVKELNEYEVVFYRIEEDIKTTRFTFAEFMPPHTHSLKNIRIPLFLTPFMRSAMEIGPFIMIGVHAEIDSIELENVVSDLYEYNYNYIGKEYSYVYRYYSNLYIVPSAENAETLNCYIMNYQAISNERGSTKAVWYVNMTGGVNAYTHCTFDRKFKEKESLDKFNNFIKVLESREYNKDSELQGVWLRNNDQENRRSKNLEERIYTWLVNVNKSKNEIKNDRRAILDEIRKEEEKFKESDEKLKVLGVLDKRSCTTKEKNDKNAANTKKSIAKKRLEDLHRELHEEMSERPDEQTELIVFRNVNNSKSNLGAHNEILDVLMSAYNH
ncbi:hypothetical protein NEMIN01_2318 [Nematocida minor]|uniref:uncharacterized protein n=1 Tax=Nematocida minor TaxID=1912983 RepID=UPI0022202A1E|nr:uncharacterized protein NEMIN01_2318 [Nematocida minor]KAI5192962.1 hypothetical protein NEMIN01_2318 [Nematocida minor]